MRLRIISLLLASVVVSAHVGYSHDAIDKEEFDKSQAFQRRTEASLLPVKTNRSTIDWKQDSQPFRLGKHQFTSLKEFKDMHARCGSREPPESVVIASQEEVEAYFRGLPEGKSSNATRRLQSIRIPVHFHCITSGGSGQCSGTEVNQQIGVLNAAFSPTFSFDLVSSQSYNRPEYYNCDVDDTNQERRMKEEFHKGEMDTLNVYSCDLAHGILGRATYPDGYYGGGARDVYGDTDVCVSYSLSM
jgi:hypothetical protein